MNIERAKRCFKNHKATLTDYGNIKILDFKNPESSEYRIRFLFEEDYCRLHISGDLGELIATNYNNMTYEKFARDFVNNVGYFEEKIDCHSRDLYVYDEDDVKKDLKKIIDDYALMDEIRDDYGFYEDTDEEVLDSFFYDVFKGFDGNLGVNGTGWETIAKYVPDAFEIVSDLGKRHTDILDWYMLAFKLAQEDLRKGGE